MTNQRAIEKLSRLFCPIDILNIEGEDEIAGAAGLVEAGAEDLAFEKGCLVEGIDGTALCGRSYGVGSAIYSREDLLLIDELAFAALLAFYGKTGFRPGIAYCRAVIYGENQIHYIIYYEDVVTV